MRRAGGGDCREPPPSIVVVAMPLYNDPIELKRDRYRRMFALCISVCMRRRRCSEDDEECREVCEEECWWRVPKPL